MVYEKPEHFLMTSRPRDIAKDHLVDFKLIVTAYLFIGLIQASIAYSNFFLYYWLEGGLSPSQILFKFDDSHLDLQSQARTLYFYALVVCQFGNVLTSRTFRVSTFEQNPLWGPKQNRRIFLAMLVSCAFVVLVLYIPFFQTNLNVSPLPTAHWQVLVLPWVGALLLMLANESRKYWIRSFPDGHVASLAVQ